MPRKILKDTDDIDRLGVIKLMMLDIAHMVARQEGLLPPARLQNWT
jgi:hypothetical protein